MKRSGIVCGIIALVSGAFAAQAQTIAVYPPAAQLGNAEACQRLVVQQTRADGVTIDVTAQAQIVFKQEGIASWTDLQLRPVADGETEAVITLGDQQLTVPVKVSNAAVVNPMSFRNDMIPVIMRSGCNTGGCHGSASGKNGFRLSLFGFDPGYDYTSLTRDIRSRRINIALPEESLMLLKPIGAVDHEGGTVLQKKSHLYETVRRWIAEGAKDDPADVKSLASIEILPREAVLEGENATQQFVVTAAYSDGSTRDVTDLSVLSTSDEQSLKVDAQGLTTSAQSGEVYIMARFGTFAVVSKVIVVPANATNQYPDPAPHNFVDEFVFAKLKKLRVPPAELCSDPVFIRRLYIDILSKLPTVEETRAFLADPDPEKRSKLIAQLLERPEFSELWAMKWAEVLRVTADDNIGFDRKGMLRYNDWLRHSITSNTPMDQLVRELLTAEGGNFTNPATNFFVVDSDPLVMAENVAQVFMGVQIKCAQCHNHPFERWTMDDYYSFAAFFAQVGRKPSSDPRENIIFNRGSGEVTNIRDGQVMQPKFLGGPRPELNGRDRRAAVAEWLTSPDNPWFSKNIANRVWQHFFGAGIIDPPDDVRVTNPPSNPQLLDELGKRLVSYNYDLRKLVSDICNSYAYQMSTQPRDETVRDTRNFAYAQVRRLSAEQMLDAICQVTDSQVKFANLPLGARATQVADGKSGVYFLEVFGRPPRDTVCTCERRAEPTLAQSLHLINGNTLDTAIKSGEGRLNTLLAAETPTPQVIEELYLAAMSRPPTPEEAQHLEAYVASQPDRRLALEDTFWSILNSKEFVFNH
ncbi:MAG: DUF1553 domain-containing protein [Candidatus Hydrogenedentes bacterium]|nr:DUF1553 domain-containing protein [Candidatus Hydrogenedentota bacterium]